MVAANGQVQSGGNWGLQAGWPSSAQVLPGVIFYDSLVYKHTFLGLIPVDRTTLLFPEPLL